MDGRGFVSGEDGSFSGYYIEYLDEIAKYTGWEYEYTAVETYEALERACESGDYDLIPGVVYTREYDGQYFDYPAYTMGTRQYVFAAPKDSGIRPDRELAYMEGIRIGIPGLDCAPMLEQRFADFCYINGISCASDPLRPQPDGANLYHIEPSLWEDKIESREIDGILCTDTFSLDQGLYAAASFGMDRIYFAAPNGKREILQQLDSALEKIMSVLPDYNARLYEKYFKGNSERLVSFSEEEQRFLEQGCVWKVALPQDFAPYAYINDAGEPSGAVIEVLRTVTEKTEGQMRFEYQFYDGTAAAEKSVREGKSDMCGISVCSALLGRDFDARCSVSYYSDVYAYYQSGGTLPENTEEKAGLPGDQTDWKFAADTASQCLAQVEQGNSEYTVLLSHVGNYYKSYYGYDGLTGYPVPDGEAMLSFSYSSDMAQTAVDIIDKCLLALERDKLDAYVTEISLFEHKSHTAGTYIQEHIEVFSLILAGILSVICGLLVCIVLNMRKNAKRVYKLLYQDEITGGVTYKKFLEDVKEFNVRDHRKKLIVYLNVAGFKYINEVFGYEQGNEVLKAEKVFIDHCSDGLPCARIYADRFVVLIAYRDLELVKQEIRRRLEDFDRDCRIRFPSFNIWIKAGAYAMQKEDGIQKAVNLANYAVDEIDKTSRSEFVLCDKTMHDRIVMQKEIEKDMRRAMENREFEAFYQPKYNIETKELIGAEALVRWRHQEKGLLPPGLFIPIFEKNHFIIQVDFYIFECVCRFIQRMMHEGKKLFPISSNFSRLHLAEPEFVERLTEIVERYQVPSNYLEIEITETVATEDFDGFVNTVKRLKEKGFLVSIDDFGSGYSSIQLLYKLPIDVLKFDKVFVDHQASSRLETELVDSIITVSHRNGIRIICEGVETPEQEEFVRQHNCIYVQGYLYSKPVPEKEFEAMIR